MYFITICTQNRVHLFGEIVGEEMVLNDAGKMILTIWNEIQNDFNNTRLHELIIMPNHIHGIIEITAVGADSISARSDSAHRAEMDSACWAEMDSACRAEMDSAPTITITKTKTITVRTVAAAGIPTIIQSFKRHSTIEYIKMVRQNKLPPFNKRIWQRNYWEHIIRNENEYRRIAQYIMDNPAKWAMDKLNGDAGNHVMEPWVIYNEEPWMV